MNDSEKVKEFDNLGTDPLLAFQDFIGSDYNQIMSVNKREVGRSFYHLAKLHYDKADLVQAEENFLKALECADRPRDNFAIFKTLGFLIRIASEKLETEKAAKYINNAKDLLDEFDSTLGSLNAEYFYNSGIVNTYDGKFLDAVESYLISYRKAKEENEPELLSKCLLALATNSYNMHKFDETIDYLNQLSQLLKIIDKSYLCGAMYNLYGKTLLKLGQFDRSIYFFERANKHLQLKKCWNLYGYILLWKGNVHKTKGEFDRALVLYRLALESIDRLNFKRLTGLLQHEIDDVNDSNVDLYLDRTNRKLREKNLGLIDFKHRFVLLEILFLLAKNTGKHFDKEELARIIWKDEYNPLIHDKLIYTSVSRLRKLIEPNLGKKDRRKYILRGKDGYTFNPDAKIRFHAEQKCEVSNSIANVEISSPV